MPQLPVEIFKAYDIRGQVGSTLTPQIMGWIGQAIASEAWRLGHGEIVVGRDGRLSSPALAEALAEGFMAGGVDLIDIGLVTTPMAYFATHHLGTGAAAMVTGSHNPPGDNGLKVVLDGQALWGEAIQDLRRRIESGDLRHGQGGCRKMDITGDYRHRIVEDVRLARPLHIVLDAGHGVAGAYAPDLFRALGCQVDELCCQVDGRFPSHHPDPSNPANLKLLQARLAEGDAEVGLAFDGDGDRIGVVARDGRIIDADRLLMLLADDVLARNPGAMVIFDVKSSGNLYRWIRERGGQPLLWKTGHSVIKAKMREMGAPLAGEMSGHLFFGDRWYGFDDGLYAGARLLELLSRAADGNEILHSLPVSCATPELHAAMAEGRAHQLMAQIRDHAQFEGAREIIDMDGLRVEFDSGFGLVRASNTTPVLVMRFEADTPAALGAIQADFRRALSGVAPDLVLPF